MANLYRLTSGAETDVEGILSYTLEHWGPDQAQKYAQQLEDCIHRLASGAGSGKAFSKALPDIRSFHCGHHYIFYVHEERVFTVLAILHEKMDLVARMKNRLDA